MVVNFSDKPVIKSNKSIFLAGPTIRREFPENKDKISWRVEAIKILNELNFDGVVYVPEYENNQPITEFEKQFEWEWNALHSSSVIVFWVPRKFPELPALTTNVEFGFYINSEKLIVYGRPDGADKTRYLDALYKKVSNKKPHNSLNKLLFETVEFLNK